MLFFLDQFGFDENGSPQFASDEKSLQQNDSLKAVQMLRFISKESGERELALKKWAHAALAGCASSLPDDETQWPILPSESYQLIVSFYEDKDYSPYSDEVIKEFKKSARELNAFVLESQCVLSCG